MKPYWKFLLVILVGLAIDETIGLFLLLLSTYIVFAKSLAEQTDDFWAFCKHQSLRAGGTGVGAFVAARLYCPRPLLAAAVVGILSFLFILTTYLINVYPLGKWPTLTFARIGVMLLRIPMALLGGYLAIRFWPKKKPSSSEENEKKGRYRKFLDWLSQYFPRLALLLDAEKVRKFIRKKLPPGGTTSDDENEQHPPHDENDPEEIP